MSKLNYYNCPKHWSAVAKAQVSKNRSARRYVHTMNPGKPMETSIPLYYVLKSMDLQNYKKNLSLYLRERRLLINDKIVTEKSAPVGLLDYVTIHESTEGNHLKTNHYQLHFEKNDFLNVKYYPTLKPCDQKRIYPIKKYYIGAKDTLKVQTFQGHLYTFEHNKTNLDILKSLFCFVEKTDTGHNLVDYYKNHKLLKIVRITGTNKFKTYALDSLKIQDPESSEKRHLFVLKSKLGNLKEQYMSKGEFLKRYLYTAPTELTIVEQ